MSIIINHLDTKGLVKIPVGTAMFICACTRMQACACVMTPPIITVDTELNNTHTRVRVCVCVCPSPNSVIHKNTYVILS